MARNRMEGWKVEKAAARNSAVHTSRCGLVQIFDTGRPGPCRYNVQQRLARLDRWHLIWDCSSFAEAASHAMQVA